MEKRSIALDGPSGAGKSTLAKRAAGHFNYIYVDTGALYRCVALYMLRNNIDVNTPSKVEENLQNIDIELSYDNNGSQRMFLNSEDVTDEIRSPEVSMAASAVSALPSVRDFLLSMQREMAIKYDVIMDGRDIGTVVLPNAGLKIYLTATAQVRAQRRYVELAERGVDTSFDEVFRDMVIRDENDTNREFSPLKAADDSINLDTSDMDLEESFDALIRIISQRFGI
ncbi:MAG: (d)CMP kinase [Oscillospiraceae bacterium]|nr:(d)CMP kinase [Oscillospiraceae bacterium]